MVAMPFPADRPWTIEDLDSMPNDGQRYELLQGELIVSPSPERAHQRLVKWLMVRLEIAAEAAHSGEAVVGPMDVRLSPNNLVEPDLFYLREEQVDRFNVNYVEGAPAFVIEIVSPSSGTYDRVRKAVLYRDAGVEEYWVVEPNKRRVFVHALGGSTPTPMIVMSGTLTSMVLPTFSISINELFAAADRLCLMES
jgi:Uma2 family endonuclease